jgi:hypothetical protein
MRSRSSTGARCVDPAKALERHSEARPWPEGGTMSSGTRVACSKLVCCKGRERGGGSGSTLVQVPWSPRWKPWSPSTTMSVSSRTAAGAASNTARILPTW